MNKSKFASYLLYAIGEITLVVLGILIALIINDWNQDRLDARKEHKILADLQSEFNANYVKLRYDRTLKIKGIDNTNKRIAAIKRRDALQFIQKDTIFWHGAFTYNGSDAVLTSLLSSGEINLISNDTLKYLLTSWPEMVKDFNEDEEIHMNFIVNDYTGYQREHMTIGQYPPDGSDFDQWLKENPVIKKRYEEAMNDPLLENMMQNNLVIIDIILKEYINLEQTMITIQQMIDRALKEKS